MSNDFEKDRVMEYFIRNETRLKGFVSKLVSDVDEVVFAARRRFAEMLEDCAYLDTPDSPLANALFQCNVNLATYLELKQRGIDVHTYGAAMLDDLRSRVETPPPFEGEGMPDLAGPGTHPGEFELELVEGDGQDFDWGYNIKSCAICHQFAKYDALDLVPYMCASDDVMSDAGDQGLVRTGTIALGAHQCDFRYRQGGTPRPLAEHHPEKIRWVG